MTRQTCRLHDVRELFALCFPRSSLPPRSSLFTSIQVVPLRLRHAFCGKPSHLFVNQQRSQHASIVYSLSCNHIGILLRHNCVTADKAIVASVVGCLLLGSIYYKSRMSEKELLSLLQVWNTLLELHSINLPPGLIEYGDRASLSSETTR